MKSVDFLLENAYLRDILQQPAALRDTIEGLTLTHPVPASRFRRIVLTGMGSSYHSLHPLLLDLTGHGFPAAMVETSELVHYHAAALAADTLVVAVSQSGRSIETVRLLGANAGQAFVVGVTNTPDSPLAAGADAVVMMRAGSESTVSCKTYVATLAALAWLGGVLTERPVCLEDAPGAAVSYLRNWRDHVHQAAGEMRGVEHLFLAGRGPSLAAAGTGGLIVKEAAHTHAEGMSAAAFRHGPFEMTGANTYLLVFSGDDRTAALNARLARDVTAQGGRAGVVSETAPEGLFRIPAAPPEVRPVLEILPVQMITLGLSLLHDHEAGAFGRASKVTIVE